MRLPSSSIVRILKSIPIVVIKEGVHASSQKRRRRQDLPTPDNLRNRVNVGVLQRTGIADEQELLSAGSMGELREHYNVCLP